MKLDISSTAVEKGIDLAKDFLDKLITPTVEETGLLMKDQIASWRFKNQIKALTKAMEICKKHNINPKQISFGKNRRKAFGVSSENMLHTTLKHILQ